jgi:4-methyl-5(b-hydroxyethyl)-thiazole monophosphate biosynthesis
MSKIIAYLADGLEEVECLTVVDLLRRGSQQVEMVSIGEDKMITGSHGIQIIADKVIADCDPTSADVLFLPGGMPGTTNLANCKAVTDALIEANASGKHLAAICAAPSVLGVLGLLDGKKATCYPGFEEELKGAKVMRDGVVTDGQVTTAKGMGYAVDLGVELLRILCGEDIAKAVYDSIQHD